MKKQRTFSLAGRLTALFLAIVLIAGYAPISARAASGGAHFTDVPSSHWAFQYVERAYRDGAIVGTAGDPAAGTGVFSPDTQMTYGQFLTMLMNAFYADEMAKVTVRDPWYAPAIQVVLEHKLTYISQEQLMALANRSINRYNMSWILVKLLEDKGVALPSQQERDSAAGRIGDWDTVGKDHQAWPYYVSTVVAAGIITGVDNKGTFNGNGAVSRAAAAVIYTKTADKLLQAQNSQFEITFNENWELITVPGYRETMENIFYKSYPRLYARWGDDRTQKTVPVIGNTSEDETRMTTDWNYNGTGLRMVTVPVANQENYPAHYATAHELTHVVTGYPYLQSTWWRECLAEYGGFRYHKWADVSEIDWPYYFQLEDGIQRDWAFTAYGGQWFFAYMDDKYPTTSKGRGLIDSIHDGIKANEITTDDINDPSFNAVVKRITGYSTIEQLRQQFLKELDAGTWSFNGFAGYKDNYITENLPGVPNPTYPTPKDFNLCTGTYVYNASGEASAQYAANNLVDGDRSTKWQATKEDSNLTGTKQHELGIGLNRSRTFNTYTLYHEGSQGNGQQNTTDWRLYYYDAQNESWVLFDEVHNNTQNVTTRTFAPVTSQFIWLEILNSGGTGDGTVRLYELELYNKN